MKYIFLISTLLISVFSLAQQQTSTKYAFPEKLKYKSSIITTFENETFKTDEISIMTETNQISYLKNFEQYQQNLHGLNSIKVEKGNHALLYGIAALGIGLTVFQLIYSGNGWDDPFNDIEDSKITGTLIGCVVVPLAISIPIGLDHKKYKKIFDDGRFINNK